MEQHCLAIVRRSDLIDLFKFGHLTVHQAITFDGNVEKHANDERLFDLVTCRMNMYDYSFEYMLLHFTCPVYSGLSVNVTIERLRAVYAFDEEAKREFSLSFDKRINLQVSPWAKFFDSRHKEMQFAQQLKGIDNIWRILQLPREHLKRCKDIVPYDILKEAFEQQYTGMKLEGKHSIWVYLLRYERHSYYPKEQMGFFCDMMHTYMNFAKEQVLDGEQAEKSNLYGQLSKEDNFITLYQKASKTPLSELTHRASNCDFIKVAPLFLLMKDLLADGITNQKLEECKSQITDDKEDLSPESSLAFYLIGFILGHDKTYNAYYDCLPLPFMEKGSEPTPSLISQPQERINLPEKESTPNKNKTPFQEKSYQKSEASIIFYMHNGKKGKNRIQYEAHSEEEKISKEKQGYKIYKDNKRPKGWDPVNASNTCEDQHPTIL